MPYGPSGASPSPGMENHGFSKADVPLSLVLRVPSPGTQFGHLVSPPVRSQAPTPLGPCSSPHHGLQPKRQKARPPRFYQTWLKSRHELFLTPKPPALEGGEPSCPTQLGDAESTALSASPRAQRIGRAHGPRLGYMPPTSPASFWV